MGVKAWMAACAAATALASATAASATIYTLTFQGTVGAGEVDSAPYDGIDGAGLFGAAGASLVGDSFTAVIAFDSTIGGDVYPGYVSVFGDEAFGEPSPITSATLTINSETHAFTDFYETSAGITNQDYGPGQFDHGFNTWIFGEGPHPDGITLSYGQYTLGPFASGDFRAGDGATSALLIPNSGWSSPDVPLASIPEPTTWAMLLLGVGVIGFAARRRNAGVPLAA